jgi:hypothetical protein
VPPVAGGYEKRFRAATKALLDAHTPAPTLKPANVRCRPGMPDMPPCLLSPVLGRLGSSVENVKQPFVTIEIFAMTGYNSLSGLKRPTLT